MNMYLVKVPVGAYVTFRVSAESRFKALDLVDGMALADGVLVEPEPLDDNGSLDGYIVTEDD